MLRGAGVYSGTDPSNLIQIMLAEELRLPKTRSSSRVDGSLLRAGFFFAAKRGFSHA